MNIACSIPDDLLINYLFDNALGDYCVAKKKKTCKNSTHVFIPLSINLINNLYLHEDKG